jgi:hypothetical protein
MTVFSRIEGKGRKLARAPAGITMKFDENSIGVGGRREGETRRYCRTEQE